MLDCINIITINDNLTKISLKISQLCQIMLCSYKRIVQKIVLLKLTVIMFILIITVTFVSTYNIFLPTSEITAQTNLFPRKSSMLNFIVIYIIDFAITFVTNILLRIILHNIVYYTGFVINYHLFE